MHAKELVGLLQVAILNHGDLEVVVETIDDVVSLKPLVDRDQFEPDAPHVFVLEATDSEGE